MKITNKLKLIGIVPSAVLLLASLYFLYTFYLNTEKARVYRTALENNGYLEKALIETGKERGLSLLFLASGDKRHHQLLQKQRSATDEALEAIALRLVPRHKALLGFLPGAAETGPLDSATYERIQKSLKKLDALRREVNQQKNTVASDILERFRKELESPILSGLSQIVPRAPETSLASLSLLLRQLYDTEADTGLSRDLAAYHLQARVPMSARMLRLWERYRGGAARFQLERITDADLKKAAESVLATPKAKRILKEEQALAAAILSKSTTGNYGVDAARWFTLQTQHIALYKALVERYTRMAREQTEAYLQHQSLLMGLAALFILLALILLSVGYHALRDVETNLLGLERSLTNAAEEFASGGDEYEKILQEFQGVDFATREGIEKGYRLLEALIRQARRDRITAMEENEAKSLFLANMSHEIRTPMNGIIGFTELLKSTNLNDEQREFANIIEKSSQNLLGIINNILDLSKIESNKVEVEHVAFDTHHEFDNTVDNFGVLTAEKDIELYYFIDPEISPRLKGDPTKIKEILTNLLNNAVKFTEPGGEISVEIQKLAATQGDRSLIEFRVSDTGIGMSQAQLKKIFEPFTQADSSITRKYGGTGLGLTITKEYVEIMGGKLNVESEEGVGSTFSFTLPLEELEEEEQSYRNAFESVTICRYQDERVARLNGYLDRYADYFGMRFLDFDSVSRLQEILKEADYPAILIDYDRAPAKIREALEHLPGEDLFLVARVTTRNELEQYELPNENIVYKPATFTKVLGMLRAIARYESAEHKASTAPKLHTRYEGKVLVVEDNIINQKLVKNILEGLGLQVEIANNGLEAFEKRRSNDYDLIFMDIQMPVMNGVEATHEILEYEEDEELPHIPIVALTANALKGDRERFLSEGMDEYISKPIEISELIYILNKFLHEKAVIETVEEHPAPAAPTEGAAQMQSAEAPQEILVAKNLPFSRKLLAKLLGSLGSPYRVADSPREALELLRSRRISMMFADEKMLEGPLLQAAREAGVLVVFTSVPEHTERLEGLDYVVYTEKMTRENFKKFIEERGR